MDEEISDQEPPAPIDDSTSQDPTERAEYQTLANGHLNPRHRRFAQLVAEGKSVAEIRAELGYSDSRISILKRNGLISAEVARLQNRIFEETVQSRLKTFAEPALNNIQSILTDRTNRVKTSEKMALSQWVVEKLDGKAASKVDVGENLLGVLMDRLDARRTSGASAPVPGSGPETIDVTPARPSPDPTQPRLVAASAETSELDEWIREFASTQSSE